MEVNGHPTVDDVLRLDVLRRARPEVVAGRTGTNRRVRWAHVSELADIAGLLSGGELLLTTGVNLPDDDSALASYVADLAAVGAAGLVVELGRRFHDELPPALVRAADGRDLPLVVLRDEARFVAVTEAVHSLVAAAQVEELRASEHLHETFTELTVEGADVSTVVHEAARLAGRPVVLENLARQVLAFDPAGEDPAILLDDWETRSRSASGALARGRTTYDEVSGWLATVVGARGEDWGRLVVVGRPAASPSSRDLMLVERAAGALALNRLVERDRESLERQTHRSLLAAVLTHSLPSSDVALRAKALGVPLDGRRLCAVVLRPRSAEGMPVLEAEQRLRDLAESAAAAVKDMRLFALVGSIDDASVGVLVSGASADKTNSAVERIADALPSDGSTVVAIGSVVDSLRDARRSFLEAAQVADAAAFQPAQPFYRLPDVRLRGLLQLLRDDARLQTFVEREIGPLLAYDAQHGTRLVAMLDTYLQHGRNKSAAADAAHLSRPSFYERLHKVERILGVDLDSVESCLSLHVALVALSAVRRERSTGSA